MKKSSRPVITGIITAVILLAALVSCGNLNIRKQATIVISFGNARSVISYQKSDTAYYMISLQPEVQQPKRVEATQNAAEITGLEEGTYTLLVKAYNANDELIAEGRAENIQVVAGETAAATVQMAAKTYHVHDFATEWTTDAAYHWHAATCGDTEEVQDRAEHCFGEWITVTPATEENEGQKKRTCTVCNYETTEVIPLLNHTHVWMEGWSYDAEGHYHNCTGVNCSEIDEKIPHTWDAGDVTTQPTCTEDGVKTFTCTVCQATKTEAISATGHTFSEAWTHNDTEHWHECTSSNCSEIDQFAEHDWVDKENTYVAPTCTEPGLKTQECSVCGETRPVTIPATGHNRGASPVTITKDPTCFTDGKQQYTCESCNNTITEPIPALGWCETPIDAETFMPATKSSKLILFGAFPQKVLPKDDETKITERTIEKNGVTYYIDSDGEYYVKSDVKPGISGYKFSDNSSISSGTSRYFKVEPIEWNVLTTGYDWDGEGVNEPAVLLSSNGILIGGGDAVWNDVTHSKTGNPGYFYEDSQARAYLNGISYDTGSAENDDKWLHKGFLQQAFTDTAKEKIKETSVDNSKNVAQPGNPTEDYIFIFSYSEWSQYKSKINNIPSDFAKKNGLILSDDSKKASWWLRSSSGSSIYYYVANTGETQTASGAYQTIGYIPALCIDLPDAN